MLQSRGNRGNAKTTRGRGSTVQQITINLPFTIITTERLFRVNPDQKNKPNPNDVSPT